MEIKVEVLGIKGTVITPLQKLVLVIIIERTVAPMNIGCDYTAGEMGKLLGVTRKTILDELDNLVELDYIVTNVMDRTRSTMITPRFKKLIK